MGLKDRRRLLLGATGKLRLRTALRKEINI
jgi:hypothetical protein